MYRMSRRGLNCVAVIGLGVALSAAPAVAQDPFVGVRCGSDIPKALLGKKSANGPVSVTERKHPDLKLRDLGSSEVTGGMSYISWAICGNEYALLERDGRIRDVILF